MAVTLDLELYRNDTTVFDVEITEGMLVRSDDNDPADLTGFTFAGEVRRSADSTEILAEFVFDETNIADGTLRCILYPFEVADLETHPGMWDLQVTSPDATPFVTTTHRGVVTVVDDVTENDG